MNDSLSPMSLLLDAQSNDKRVIINLRNNRKMVCDVVAFDKHFNCVLKNVVEMGKASNKNRGIAKKEGVEYEKSLGSIYLRGDNIISITMIE